MSNCYEDYTKRRTFAIISHPDAGKTTVTEKLLLFGGAIQLAGTVKGRKASRHATSDWMKMEQERGISVTTSVMQFIHNDHIMNLLEEVARKLPRDKKKMLAVIEEYQSLPAHERLIYRVGRRGGAYRFMKDLQRDPATYDKISALIRDLMAKGGEAAVEKFMTEVVDQYV